MPAYTARIDGKEYPLISTGFPGRTVTLKRIDNFTIESLYHGDGKKDERATITTTPDGQTLTTRGEKGETSVFRRFGNNKDRENTLIGTWHEDRAAPNLATNDPDIMTYESRDENKIRYHGKSGDEFTAAYDGKQYPMVEGMFRDEVVELKRISKNLTDEIHTRKGRVEATYRLAISPDGKILTVTWTLYPAKGEPIRGTDVYDRQ